MASLKFTKNCIDVSLNEIINECNEALTSLKEEDVYESLNGVETRCNKIEDRIKDILFRISQCEEY